MTFEREKNHRDVLEALGEHKCDTGMSVENVREVVYISTLKGRFKLLQTKSLLGVWCVW